MSDPTPNAANIKAVDDLLAIIHTPASLRAAILAALEEKDAEWSKTFHEELDNEREGPKSQGLVPHRWATNDEQFGPASVVHFGYKAPPGHILDDTGTVRAVPASTEALRKAAEDYRDAVGCATATEVHHRAKPEDISAAWNEVAKASITLDALLYPKPGTGEVGR